MITDGQGLELVETADILTSFKLTGLIADISPAD
ncbi:hypothetical protein SS7213T_02493, partial [Staphylococcus simiae CCM 7213 = CCUG 51256]